MLRGFGLVVALLAVGCGGDDAADCDKVGAVAEPTCEAGRSNACACSDGSMGAQTCTDDGSKWGACECNAQPGGAGSGAGGRKFAYEADPICKLSDNPDFVSLCKQAGGNYTRPMGECALPADGELVHCVILSEPSNTLYACCE